MPTTSTPRRKPAASWTAKRDQHPAPHVERLDVQKGAGYPPGAMLIASPLAIEAIVRAIPRGRVLTLGDLRARLARDHGADYTCQITTGIFTRIMAEAAEEERALGRRDVAPWWRVVRDSGQLIEKAPGGPARHAELLQAEGITFAASRARVPTIAALEAVRWRA